MSSIRLGLCILVLSIHSVYGFFGFGGGMSEHYQQQNMHEPIHYTEHSFQPVHFFKPKFFKKPVPVPVIIKPIIKTVRIPYKVKEPVIIKVPVPVKVPVVHREKVPVPYYIKIKTPYIVKEPYPVKVKEPVIVKVPMYKEYQQSYEHKPSYESSYGHSSQNMDQSGYNSPQDQPQGGQAMSYEQSNGGGEYGTSEDEGKYYQQQENQDAYGGQMQQQQPQQSYGNSQQQFEPFDSENENESHAYAANGPVVNIDQQRQYQKPFPINFQASASQISTQTQYKTGQLHTKQASHAQPGMQDHVMGSQQGYQAKKK